MEFCEKFIFVLHWLQHEGQIVIRTLCIMGGVNGNGQIEKESILERAVSYTSFNADHEICGFEIS